MADPLPDLGAADLGGGGVLHQMVEGHAAGAAQPRFDVADPDIEILPEPRLGDRACGDREKVRGDYMHILPFSDDLVRLRHLAAEDLLADCDKPRMVDPAAVIPVPAPAPLTAAALPHTHPYGPRVSPTPY